MAIQPTWVGEPAGEYKKVVALLGSRREKRFTSSFWLRGQRGGVYSTGESQLVLSVGIGDVVRAKEKKKKKTAHGAESPGVLSGCCARRTEGAAVTTPPPGEDAVLHRERDCERAGGADLAAPSSTVDPSDDVGEGGTTTENQC
eukprot:3695703-Prymnesium_polylepis.2